MYAAGCWARAKAAEAIHAHCKTFLLLLDWDTSTPNAAKRVLHKVTKELLLHARHMVIWPTLICVRFKLMSAGARYSPDFRRDTSNVFVFPPPEQHLATC